MQPKRHYPIVRDVHFLLGPNVEPGDAADLFGVKPNGPVHTLESATLHDLLVIAELFPSKGEARRNYRGGGDEWNPFLHSGTDPKLPTGYFEIGPVGKSKTMLFVWNPATRLSDWNDDV